MGEITYFPHYPRLGATPPAATQTATQVEMFVVRVRDGRVLIATTSEPDAHSYHRSAGGARFGAYIDRVKVWLPDGDTTDDTGLGVS